MGVAPREGGLMLAVELAVAKVAKYAVRESGDSVEVIERPNGGLSVVMVDGQRTGRSAKAISNLAVRKAISLLAEGVRDGAVARATHDFLRTQRGGQVSAELTIISVDLETRTVVVSRNTQCPVMIWEAPCEGEQARWVSLDEPARTVGVGDRVKPVIAERALTAGQVFVAFTDGVLHAGARKSGQLDVSAVLTAQCGDDLPSAQFLADCVLNAALAADDNRPGDDTTVVVMRVYDRQPEVPLEVRRMSVSFPVPPV
jgi:serine phosphatase RsbU (regulator of sigma subunit)